jgi:hypothetical protein
MQPTYLIEARDPQWDAWLQQVPHDVYQTSRYHLFSQESGEGRAFLIVCGTKEKFLAIPFLLAPIAGTSQFDVMSVYGYPGPCVWNCQAGDSFLAYAWQQIFAAWREQRVVSAFLRFHPVLQNQRWIEEVAPEVLRYEGDTVSVDLTLSPESNWRQYARNLRSEINSSRAAGFETALDRGWTYFAEFSRLYKQTMTRNHAAERYFFSDDYIFRLRSALGDHAHLFVTRQGDTVAAATIVTEFNGLIQLHLSGIESDLLRYSPHKVAYDDIRKWGQSLGHHTLHMGGGRGGAADSLFTFKARFSPRRHSFVTGRIVLDAEAYREIFEEKSRICGLNNEPAQTNFFPAYRAPMFSETPVLQEQ